MGVAIQCGGRGQHKLMAHEKSLAVGLMSGTSMDGIDACVVEISEEACNNTMPRHVRRTLHHSNSDLACLLSCRLRLLSHLVFPYPRGLKAELLRVCAGGTVGEVCSYNVLLGRLFADAARAVMARCGAERERVTVIGSHG